LPVDPGKIPRFRLNLDNINYPLLICKALYIDHAHGGYMADYEYQKEGHICKTLSGDCKAKTKSEQLAKNITKGSIHKAMKRT
jgi:hypothetical protein